MRKSDATSHKKYVCQQSSMFSTCVSTLNGDKSLYAQIMTSTKRSPSDATVMLAPPDDNYAYPNSISMFSAERVLNVKQRMVSHA